MQCLEMSIYLFSIRQFFSPSYAFGSQKEANLSKASELKEIF